MTLTNKVLVLDIETFPLIAAVWGLKDQNIGLNQIRSDWSVMAWGAKWFNEPSSKVMYMDVRNQKNLRDDKKIIAEIWKLLDEADIVITQNGQSFDGPKLNARFIWYGMKPPSPYKHLDTYRIVKRVADFTSNKLEYLTDKLCVKYKKLHHSKFPGMSLWTECGKHNIAAWNEMKKYNIHDVLSTEELYTKLQAWAPVTMPSPNVPVIVKPKCLYCNSYNLRSLGIRRTKELNYRRYICHVCGKAQKEIYERTRSI